MGLGKLFKQVGVQAGKGAAGAVLGIDLGGGKNPVKAALRELIVEDVEVQETIAKCVAAGLLMAAQAEEDNDGDGQPDGLPQ